MAVVSRILVGGIDLCTPRDGKTNGWDLGQDVSYTTLVGELVYVDWVHMAPPGRTLSSSRRTDEYGSVPVRRTNDEDYGYGKENVDVNLRVECGISIAEDQLKHQT